MGANQPKTILLQGHSTFLWLEVEPGQSQNLMIHPSSCAYPSPSHSYCSSYLFHSLLPLHHALGVSCASGHRSVSYKSPQILTVSKYLSAVIQNNILSADKNTKHCFYQIKHLLKFRVSIWFSQTNICQNCLCPISHKWLKEQRID